MLFRQQELWKLPLKNMFKDKELNLILHLIAPFAFSLFLNIDVWNFILGLIISFLIINLYLSCQYTHLSFNKVFLIGAYYYLAIFPLFYSLNLFKAETFNSWDLSLTSLVCILSLLGYSVGQFIYDYFSGKKTDLNHPTYIFKHGIGTRKIDLFLVIFILILNLVIILTIGEIRSFFILTTVGILLIYMNYSKLSTTSTFLLAFLVSVVSIIPMLFFSDSRSDLMKLVIIIGFLYFFLNRRKVNFIQLASTGIFLFAGAILITIFRTNTGQSIVDDLHVINESYQGIFGIILRLGDIGIAFDNLIYIVKNSSLDNLLLGSTLIRPIFFLIPRSLWVEKPIDTSLLIIEERYGSLSEFGGGTSQSITIVGELFWNFSYFGVFTGLLILALIIRSIDNVLCKTESLSTIYLLTILVPFFFIIWRGAFSSELVYTLISMIPIIFLIFLHKLFKELPQYRNSDRKSQFVE